MSGRISLGGASTNPATGGAKTRADLATFAPSDSILFSSGSPLEKGHVFDAADDIIASVRLVALMLLIGTAIGAAVFWWMFF